MSALSLSGVVTLSLNERRFENVLLPLVSLASGCLLGGAFFHLLPASIELLGDGLAPFFWTTAGFVGFLVLELFLRGHHGHGADVHTRDPMGHLILLADTLHNFIDGTVVAGAFIVDTRLGLTTWLLTAAHELPQELGDFAILVQAGWTPKKALTFNLLSSLTFLLGGVATYALSETVNVAYLLPLAAGNFLYIAAADLLPEMSRHPEGRRRLGALGTFLLGLLLVLALHLLEP